MHLWRKLSRILEIWRCANALSQLREGADYPYTTYIACAELFVHCYLVKENRLKNQGDVLCSTFKIDPEMAVFTVLSIRDLYDGVDPCCTSVRTGYSIESCRI